MIAGAEVPHPEIAGLDVEGLTRTPRKYGLHATLKPPFRLREDMSETELEKACATFAARHAPVTAGGLTLTRMGRFLSLCPSPPNDALKELAAKIVENLDPFRAPESKDRLQRRRGAGLSPSQEANLANWGYPYVMEDFRFHITLTGRQPKARLPEIETALAGYLAPQLPSQTILADIALAGEDQDGRFHLLQRFSLAA